MTALRGRARVLPGELADGARARELDGRVARLTALLEDREEKIRELEAEAASAREQIEELRTELRASFLRENEERKLRSELDAASGRLESRIDEMRGLLEGIVDGSSGAEREELARYEERIADLEGDLRTSEIARLELQSRSQRELMELADHSRREIDALQRSLAEEQTAGRELRARVEQLEAQGIVDGGAGAESSRLAEELAKYEERIADLEAELRTSEIARLELESRSQRELMELADQSRGEVDALERSLAEKQAAADELRARVEQLEAEGIAHGASDAEASSIAERLARYEERIADLEDELRTSEIARLELESRSQRELMELADHSRREVVALERALAGERAAARELRAFVEELEGRAAGQGPRGLADLMRVDPGDDEVPDSWEPDAQEAWSRDDRGGKARGS